MTSGMDSNTWKANSNATRKFAFGPLRILALLLSILYPPRTSASTRVPESWQLQSNTVLSGVWFYLNYTW